MINFVIYIGSFILLIMQYNKMIKILIILGVLVILPIQVYAIHPLQQYYPFNIVTQYLCYHTSSLDYVKFNGQTDQGSALQNEIDKGRMHLNSNTDMTVIKIDKVNGV